MTCLVSKETKVSLAAKTNSCSPENKTSNNNRASLKKDSCCLFDNGIIESDVDLIQANQHTLVALALPVKTIIIIPKGIDLSNNFSLQHYCVESPPDIPIRILHQSFLC